VLIEPKARKVEVYRQGKAVEILQNPKSLSGENVLPGFALNLGLEQDQLILIFHGKKAT